MALYVDNVRLISGSLLHDYQEYLSRYKSHLDGYVDSTAAPSQDGPQDPSEGGAVDPPGLGRPSFPD